MPQMAPMNWMILFMMFFATLMFLFFKFFYLSSQPMNVMNYSKESLNNNNFWKW